MSSPEIMRRVTEAEKEGRLLVEAAQRDISRMRKDLPRKAASIREETLRDAAAQKEKALKEAQQQGAQEAQQIASRAQAQIKALSNIPESKRKQALEKAMAVITT